MIVAALLPLEAAAQASARTLYTAAQQRETILRESIERASERRGAPPTIEQIRAAVARYEEVVRRYPRSGYSDNALWQAAGLSSEAFRLHGQQRDHRSAIRMLRALISEYPSSSLVPRAKEALEVLERPPAVTTKPPQSAGAPSATGAILRGIHRTLLPELVRVTIVLDKEVPYREERLDGPARLFFDFQGTRSVPELSQATLSYGEGAVRYVRTGLHPDGVTRVVLDMEDVARYSVVSLYNPYRVVVDCVPRRVEGRPAATAAQAPPPLTATTAADDGSPRSDPPKTPVQNTAEAVAPTAPPAANLAGGFSLSRQLGLGISRVVIDPGHGGRDPGARSGNLSEAEIVLDIALRLEKLLLKEPGFEVVLTRRTDVFIPLEERTAIANREAADLFLSIHANASRNREARGVETYVLNFASSAEAAAVAARENASSNRTMSSLPDIVRAIALTNKRDESKDFASFMQTSLTTMLRPVNRELRDLGVKQAPFVVLIGAEMPSVLVEVSFLSNRNEGRLLASPAYRQRIAEALLDGLRKYRLSLKSPHTLTFQ
jgi:N-acetylmuramoyl-L-alanine amidase